MLPDLEILDHIAKPVFVLVPDQDDVPRYLFWNRASETWGGRPREQVIGKTARDIFHGQFGISAYERHLEVMRSSQSLSYDLVLDIQGEPTEVRTTLSPWRRGDGTLRAVIGSSAVLSSVVMAQTREIETMAFVERARSEMEQYLAFAAHDLRAPMRRMLGLAELLQEDLPDDAAEAIETAKLMEETSRKAQELINEVLKFSEASNAHHREETFDFEKLARDIFTVLDPMRQHDLSAVNAKIIADKTALQIVLRNLVDNAIKHNDRDRTRLTLSLDDSSGGLDVLVRDNGPGLPDGDLDFLDGGNFEYGNGFGLLGIRRLIRMRHGNISARNAPEGGTEFRIHLPGTRYSFAQSD